MHRATTNIIRSLLITGLIIAMFINYVYILKADGFFSKGPFDNMAAPASLANQSN